MASFSKDASGWGCLPCCQYGAEDCFCLGTIHHIVNLVLLYADVSVLRPARRLITVSTARTVVGHAVEILSGGTAMFCWRSMYMSLFIIA